MNMILWRHAEAEDEVGGTTDAARALTAKGEKQAHKMAAWLKGHIDGPLRVLVSPATRAQQTAQALDEEIETRTELAVGASATRILRVTGWPSARGTVIVVGHQPTLGRLAALLLSGKETDWRIKKGAIWWFDTAGHDNKARTYLRAVLAPQEL
jgi:phosphohistidine phosphatase